MWTLRGGSNYLDVWEPLAPSSVPVVFVEVANADQDISVTVEPIVRVYEGMQQLQIDIVDAPTEAHELSPLPERTDYTCTLLDEFGQFIASQPIKVL